MIGPRQLPAGQGGTSLAAAGVSVCSGAGRGRQLHAGHFAFMRAIVQGLDARASWERYFKVEGDVPDQRVVRSTIAWIRDAFAAAAQRHDRFGTARLVRMDAARMADPAHEHPSLADFAAAQGLTDERESDQIAAYEAAHEAADRRTAQRQRRRARLIARQLEALRWLETLVAQAPRAGDAVSAWLHPSLAGHLEAAGITTLQQLAERINGVGRHWHAGIRALGQGKAQRIVDWLCAHQQSTALCIGSHVTLARSRIPAPALAAIVAPATAIRPLEKFIPPPGLDGRRGTRRCAPGRCRLDAVDDHQAVLAWLNALPGATLQPPDGRPALSNTQRVYRKEAERLLLWATIQRGKALSSLDGEDCAAYLGFLADPQPRSLWCAPRGRPRWSPLWRPFEGRLSASAQRHAVTVLKVLHRFLVDQAYLTGHPWAAVAAVAAVPAPGAPPQAARSLSPALWAFVETRLALLPASSAHQRLRVGLHLLRATGLRLSALVRATVDDLQWVVSEADTPRQRCMLQVAGKGGTPRALALPEEVVHELARYLQARGLAPDLRSRSNPGAFLLGKASDAAARAPGLHPGPPFDPRQGIAASTFAEQTKAFFTGCARVLQGQGDTLGAAQLARASTQWLRPTPSAHPRPGPGAKAG